MKKKIIQNKISKKEEKDRRTFTIIMLSLPLIIAIGLLVNVFITKKTVELSTSGIRFAPVVSSTPLILGLSIFIGGYILFLIMMFHGDFKQIYLDKRQN